MITQGLFLSEHFYWTYRKQLKKGRVIHHIVPNKKRVGPTLYINDFGGHKVLFLLFSNSLSVIVNFYTLSLYNYVI